MAATSTSKVIVVFFVYLGDIGRAGDGRAGVREAENRGPDTGLLHNCDRTGALVKTYNAPDMWRVDNLLADHRSSNPCCSCADHWRAGHPRCADHLW